MRLTRRENQSIPLVNSAPVTDQETAESIRQERERELWRVDWKRLGYDFCGVYCVSPDNRWPTKVGVSQNPSRRIASLQTACWKRLDIAEYRYAENAAKAREVEKSVHRMLTEDGKLLEGEWFDIKPEKAIETIEFAAGSLGIELRSDIPDEVVKKAIDELLSMRSKLVVYRIWDPRKLTPDYGAY